MSNDLNTSFHVMSYYLDQCQVKTLQDCFAVGLSSPHGLKLEDYVSNFPWPVFFIILSMTQGKLSLNISKKYSHVIYSIIVNMCRNEYYASKLCRFPWLPETRIQYSILKQQWNCLSSDNDYLTHFCLFSLFFFLWSFSFPFLHQTLQ